MDPTTPGEGSNPNQRIRLSIPHLKVPGLKKNRMYSTIADPDDAEDANVNNNSLRSCNEDDNEEVRFRGSNAQNESHSHVQEASHLDAEQDPIAQFRRKQKQA